MRFFVRTFDIFVKPSSLVKRDPLGDEVTGGVLGAINQYAIAVDQGLKSQNRMERNQKVTEWIQVKHWALSHWECSKGHQWNAMPIKVKNEGTWCPFCARNRKI